MFCAWLSYARFLPSLCIAVVLIFFGQLSIAYSKTLEIHVIMPFHVKDESKVSSSPHEKDKKELPSDPFWLEFQNGIAQAKEEIKFKLQYMSPLEDDINQMAGLISQSISKRPDGIIISVHDLQPLLPVIRQLQNSKIPFFTVATPEDIAYEVGGLLNIGEETYQTGQIVGAKLKQKGGRYGICVITAGTDVHQLLLCNGFIRGFGGSTKVTRVKTSKARAVEDIQNAIIRDTRVDSIFILGDGIAPDLIKHFINIESLNRFHISAFDTSASMVEALYQEEEALSIFMLTDQPYLQGYLSIINMVNYLNKGMLPSRNILTSPLFIDREKLDKFPYYFE